MFFKRITTLSRINDQIYASEKALIENQGAADHYQAAADGNRTMLKRLRLMRDADLIVNSPTPTKVVEPPLIKAKLRSAS